MEELTFGSSLIVSIVTDGEVTILDVFKVLFLEGDSVFAFGSWNETRLIIVVDCDPIIELDVVDVLDRNALCCDITA